MRTITSRPWGCRTLWLLVLVHLLSACGGGGGGGGAPPPPSVTFTANRTSVAFDYAEGSLVGAQDVIITAGGTLPSTLYVGATVEGQGIAPNIQLAVSGNQGVFSLLPAASLAPGEYTGRVLLKACSDANCAQQIGNSPIAVAYTVRVRPTLKVTPNTATLSATSGAGAAQTFAIQLPQGATASTVTVASGTEWLAIENATPTGFTLQASSLPSGQYTGSLQAEAGGIAAVIPVTYTVAPPPGGNRFLSTAPPSITLATVESAASPAATLDITPPSWNAAVTTAINYPPGSAAGWLAVTPVAGGFEVTADALDLTAGSFTAEIVVSGAWPSAAVTVPVALTVGVGLARPANESVTLNAETPASALTRATAVDVVAGPGTGWMATSNVAWLELTDAAGQTGETLGYRFDAAAVAALANGATHTATITITPTRRTMSPVSFDVTLDKRLPQVTSVGPYIHVAGRPLRVILRGAGFDAIANVADRLSLPSASVQSAVRVNDTEIVVRVDALSVGDYAIGISNALAMPSASSAIAVVAPQAFAADAIPTGGILRSLTFDAQRNALYGANLTLGTVMRFSAGGGTWTADSEPHPQVYDLGLSHDGTKLLVTRSSYQAGTAAISVVDPVTLDSLSTTELQSSLEPTFTTLGFGVKTTNDGRTWLAVGSTWAQMTSFRADTVAVTPFVPPIPTSFHSGPWYAMSRDGERLLIVQSSSISPSPPMLYMDAADSVLRVNPAGLTFAYSLAVSEDGDRVLLDSGIALNEVRDRDFNLIGRAVLPTTQGEPPYFALNRQLSHDGMRVYMLTYRDDFYSTANVMPRVFVFDSSTRQTTQEELPLLGYFDLADYPTCVPASLNDYTCNWSTIVGAISLDSQTLFFAGSQNLVVAPVPTGLTPSSVVTIGSGRTAAWRGAAN